MRKIPNKKIKKACLPLNIWTLSRLVVLVPLFLNPTRLFLFFQFQDAFQARTRIWELQASLNNLVNQCGTWETQRTFGRSTPSFELRGRRKELKIIHTGEGWNRLSLNRAKPAHWIHLGSAVSYPGSRNWTGRQLDAVSRSCFFRWEKLKGLIKGI